MTGQADGAEALERLRRLLTEPPHNRWLAPVAIAADPAEGSLEIALSFRREFGYQPDERVFHGGVVASLIDIAGHATVALWHRTYLTPTVSLQIDYLAPAAGPELRARGLMRKAGRSISRADIEVFASGRLVSLGRGTFATWRKGA